MGDRNSCRSWALKPVVGIILKNTWSGVVSRIRTVLIIKETSKKFFGIRFFSPTIPPLTNTQVRFHNTTINNSFVRLFKGGETNLPIETSWAKCWPWASAGHRGTLRSRHSYLRVLQGRFWEMVRLFFLQKQSSKWFLSKAPDIRLIC